MTDIKDEKVTVLRAVAPKATPTLRRRYAMNKIKRCTLVLARACDGSPFTSTVTLMLFYVFFNIMLETIEKLIWGERFYHWGDVIFQLCFIAYAAYAVHWCAIFNAQKGR